MRGRLFLLGLSAWGRRPTRAPALDSRNRDVSTPSNPGSHSVCRLSSLACELTSLASAVSYRSCHIRLWCEDMSVAARMAETRFDDSSQY